MQTLVREPEVADEAPTPDAPSPSDAPVAPACEQCGQPLAEGQEWCLECGTAQPGSLGGRGRRDAFRAAATIIGAVAVLVCGAVAASYAALNDHAQQQASVATPPAAVTPAPAAVAPVTPAVPAATTPTTPAVGTPALPPVKSVAVPAPSATQATVAPPATSTPTPAPSTSAPATTTPTTTTPTTTTPTGTDALQEVALGPDAASVYDPYSRATDQTDPADSYDDDPKTSFTFSTAPGTTTMGVGLDYDLVNARGVRAVEVHTSTPGGSIEVYGAKAARPATILDPGWKHLADADKVATKKADDGTVTITFDPGKYRHILLWFTTPPTAGPAVAISEVRLLD